MKWVGSSYYYNNDGDAKLIEKLLKKFLGETDIEALKTTLKFLLKANGKSYYGKANAMFSFDNNIDRAVIHYLTKAKEQGMFNDEF
nr:hypothetical protein [Rickettsia endosymbiont of Ceutorhynchus assimilis]